MPQLVAVLAEFSRPISQQVGSVHLQPIRSNCEQGLSLRQTLTDGRFRNDVPRILCEITLLAQLVQSDHGLSVDSKRRRQRLNCRLMMTRLAAQRSVSVCKQSDIGEHAHCRIRTSETRLGAYRLHLGVSDMRRRTVEQAPDRFPGGCNGLKADADQVLQGDFHPQSETTSCSPPLPSGRDRVPQVYCATREG